MLKAVVKGILGSVFSRNALEKRLQSLAERASKAMSAGDKHSAIDLYKQYLKLDPKEPNALNNLGLCLADLGNLAEAHQAFELAYRLDDSNMLVVVNHARCLVDSKNIKEAIPHLVRAQVTIPQYPYTHAIYAAIQLAVGHADKARKFALRAWLAEFDNLRLANSYMWNSSYADIPEELLAAEHQFWADTCAPIPAPLLALQAEPEQASPRKLRIGYWSPDFRNHSVRYFFRPLLEGHDRSRTETILYHDFHASDAQTEEIKLHCDAFHKVFGKGDEELYRFILSHNLDVLVELAGHTSHNRLPLLQGRLAKLQITALGYPATTGLNTLDAKLSDPFIQSADDAKFYSEKPMVLPQSFWCFNPFEDVALPLNPPVVEQGYITFGCVGNIGKINRKIVDCWAAILRRVPKSRLLLRAVNFVDKAAMDAVDEDLVAAGIKRNRFVLVGPAIDAEFFKSYNEIDIVLDTHPFNGGTTTCFAVYMGVPVVSWSGASLISRMGRSILSNVGAADLVVHGAEGYINKAVSLSQDVTYLKDFRKTSRQKMAESGLGDGVKFAHDFEEACIDFLKKKTENTPGYEAKIAPLPAEEIIRRAATVLGYGRKEAAARIVKYCIRHYPNFAGAHILSTEDMTQEGKFSEAADYLLDALPGFEGADHTAALINIVRFLILADELPRAEKIVESLAHADVVESNERLQCRLYRALLTPSILSTTRTYNRSPACAIKCIIPCDDTDAFDGLVEKIKERCTVPEGVVVSYIRAGEANRIHVYNEVLSNAAADISIFWQKCIEINNANLIEDVVEVLDHCDMAGFSGAKRWSQLDWAFDDFSQRAGGYTVPSYEKPGYLEIQIAGEGSQGLETGMCLLDGAFIAVRTAKVRTVPFDADLVGAGSLLEQAWSYEAQRAGCRLAVHRNLGIHVNLDVGLDNRYLASARTRIVEKMNFDVFSDVNQNRSVISCPCSGPDKSFAAMNNYFSDAML